MTADNGGFDAFWEEVSQRLAEAPLEIALERDDFYSPPEWTVYRLSYTSLGGYPLFAWLTIPRGAGPFPALLRMPDYASVHDIIYTPLRQHAVVMNGTYRGQRNSDSLVQAEYPGLLTEGIESPGVYAMRLVFADALRGVKALLGQSAAALGTSLGTSLGTVAVTGSGLGGALALAAAARYPEIKAAAVDTPLALGHPLAVDTAPAYPLGELQDYLRVHPHRRDAVMASAAPLDPVKLAPLVHIPTLLSLGSRDRGQCPIEIGRELADRLPQCDLRVYDGAGEGGGHEHSRVRAGWLRERLGLE